MEAITEFIIQEGFMDDEDDQSLLDLMSHKVILSCEEIGKLTLNPGRMIFAETQLLQTFNLEYIDTYPQCFEELYHRDIIKCMLSQVQAPCFIKPAVGHKHHFPARVCLNQNDIVSLGTIEDILVYCSEILDFHAEFRVYIGDGTVRGICEYTDQLFKVNDDMTMETLDGAYEAFVQYNRSRHDGSLPPPEFVQRIVELNVYKFVVVDVGVLPDKTWAVVEVNPPFSIANYGLSPRVFLDYCCSAFIYMAASI